MASAALSMDREASIRSPVRVAIIDDSVVARAALSRMIDADESFAVVAVFDGARRAISWLAANQVDIVLLDIHMPGVDGLTALPELLAAGQGARVLIVSTLAEQGARTTVEALALGAADTLAKPGTNGLGERFGAILLERMRALGRRVQRVKAADRPPAPPAELSRGPIGCLAIGASTGGVFALSSFFAALPRSFGAPILITQHLPPAFTRYFAEQVGAMAGRETHVACDGMEIVPGKVYVAPGAAHLECRMGGEVPRAALTTHGVPSRCMPSVDPMLESVARCFGEAALAVILTGMGRDGAAGADAIAAASGTVIVQDEASSAVWGMPGTIARAGVAALVAPPDVLAASVGRCGHLR